MCVCVCGGVRWDGGSERQRKFKGRRWKGGERPRKGSEKRHRVDRDPASVSEKGPRRPAVDLLEPQHLWKVKERQWKVGQGKACGRSRKGQGKAVKGQGKAVEGKHAEGPERQGCSARAQGGGFWWPDFK